MEKDLKNSATEGTECDCCNDEIELGKERLLSAKELDSITGGANQGQIPEIFKGPSDQATSDINIR